MTTRKERLTNSFTAGLGCRLGCVLLYTRRWIPEARRFVSSVNRQRRRLLLSSSRFGHRSPGCEIISEKVQAITKPLGKKTSFVTSHRFLHCHRQQCTVSPQRQICLKPTRTSAVRLSLLTAKPRNRLCCLNGCCVQHAGCVCAKSFQPFCGRDRLHGLRRHFCPSSECAAQSAPTAFIVFISTVNIRKPTCMDFSSGCLSIAKKTYRFVLGKSECWVSVSMPVRRKG